MSETPPKTSVTKKTLRNVSVKVRAVVVQFEVEDEGLDLCHTVQYQHGLKSLDASAFAEAGEAVRTERERLRALPLEKLREEIAQRAQGGRT